MGCAPSKDASGTGAVNTSAAPSSSAPPRTGAVGATKAGTTPAPKEVITSKSSHVDESNKSGTSQTREQHPKPPLAPSSVPSPKVASTVASSVVSIQANGVRSGNGSEGDESSCKSFGLPGDDSDNENAAAGKAAEPKSRQEHQGELVVQAQVHGSKRMVEDSQGGLHLVNLEGEQQERRSSKGALPPSVSTSALKQMQRQSNDAAAAAAEAAAVQQAAAGGSANAGASAQGKNPKELVKRLSSVIGLEAMIEERREAGELTTNVVRIEVPFGKPIEEVYSGVHDGRILGSGISGLVRLVTHKATGVKYAVKCLDLGLIDSEKGLHQLREEIFIMCQLDHPNIVRLEEVYESHNEIYLVQELCLGGELFDRLDEQPDYHYTEHQCARLVWQMLSAVRYLHGRGIIHRDLKLENFLFSTTSPDSELKMIDFGLSKHFDHGQVHHEAVGTPYTVAPEVIKGSYGEKCDIWAIGVITYLLLSGDPPFGGCGGPEPLMVVRNNIIKGQFKFEPVDIWSNVSQSAKDFISALLVTDPCKRPNAEAAQELSWLVDWTNNKIAENGEGGNNLNPNVVKALVGFKEYSDMRKLLCEVLSFTLLPSQIEGLKREFEKIDTEGRGEITFENLKTVLMRNAESGSLGSLTEEEVADIFNAMRVRKTDQTIHWHEFIAAGLSQCNVDDRNLRLAFDRLDAHHKGYVTFDDILDLMGASDGESEASIKAMFQDSLRLIQSKHARITYEDFLLLMKGQTHDHRALSASHQGPVMHSPVVSYRRSAARGLSPPNLSLDGPGGMSGIPVMPMLGSEMSTPAVPGAAIGAPPTLLSTANVMGGHSRKGSLTGAIPLPSVKEDPTKEAAGVDASPMVTGVFRKHLDEDDEERTGDTAQAPFRAKTNAPSTSSPSNNAMSSPSTIKPLTPQSLGRHRSKSYDTAEGPSSASRRAEEEEEDASHDSPLTPTTRRPRLSMEHYSPTDSRRSILLPEHMVHEAVKAKEQGATESASGVCSVIKEAVNDVSAITNPSKKTPLVVNRELYRAHRRMRLAVLEASKRFEEKQIVREGLDMSSSERQEHEEQSKNKEAAHPKADREDMAAGLVMKRGTIERQNSTGAERVRELLRQREAERQAQLAAATKKSGRSAGGAGRRSRRLKTVSDMSALMAGMSPPPSTPSNPSSSNDHTGISNTGSGEGSHRAVPTLSQSTSSDLAENGASNYGTSNGHNIISPHIVPSSTGSASLASYSATGQSYVTLNSLSWNGPPPDLSSFALENVSVSMDADDSFNMSHKTDGGDGGNAVGGEGTSILSPRDQLQSFSRAFQSQPAAITTIDEVPLSTNSKED